MEVSSQCSVRSTLKYRPSPSLLSACCLSLNASRGGKKRTTFANLDLTLCVAVICCRAGVSVQPPISGVEEPPHPRAPKGQPAARQAGRCRGLRWSCTLELRWLMIAADRCWTCDIVTRRIKDTQIKAIMDLNVSCLREK